MKNDNQHRTEAQTEGGKKLGRILQELLSMAEAEVRLLEIESEAVKRIKEAGGSPSFQTVPGYKWATCLCVNEVVVHGIPSAYRLKNGDVLTIDIGMVLHGFHTDTAWTKVVGGTTYASEETKKLLSTGEKTFWSAIEKAKVGGRVGDISQCIETGITQNGYHVIASLVGHGIGKALHEDPQIPGIVTQSIHNTPLLVEDETIAIEVIYAKNSGSVVNRNRDGWTLETRDRSLSAVFEHTVLVTKDSPVVLTATS